MSRGPRRCPCAYACRLRLKQKKTEATTDVRASTTRRILLDGARCPAPFTTYRRLGIRIRPTQGNHFNRESPTPEEIPTIGIHAFHQPRVFGNRSAGSSYCASVIDLTSWRCRAQPRSVHPHQQMRLLQKSHQENHHTTLL